ncbi:MATH domain and coiled-coil domain-containing protein At3g58340-like [Brassica napus]|uniref:MATH domain and coiled-coil domain-containing protein At3g58340-like n=1 Tax=Brassica napus TaxID=3708 RepID=UPI00207869F0|nr:MATH domain and coiled-coil domain-containing protein At3g58340-like [Brassica napus]
MTFCASALEEQNVSIFINTQKSLGGNYTSRGLGRILHLKAMMNPVDKKFGWTCLVVFPKGNNGDYLSLYLDVADFETLPCGWRRYVKLRLTVVNQLSPKLSVVKGDSTALMESRQLGVPAMLPLFKLHENDGGFLVKGQVMIVAELDIFEVIGTFDDVVAAESSDLLKKTSLGINANGIKQVENSVKPPPKKTWNRKFDYCC